MKMSEKALELLRKSEGLMLTAYQCTANRWTIGYGDTHGVKKGDVITAEEAERRLRMRIVQYEDGVSTMVRRPMSQGQFDVLVSLAYNAGTEALRTSQLMACFNSGDIEGAARQMGRWIHVSGGSIELRRGDTGQQVLEWQRELDAKGFATKADGDFGAKTEANTKAWQTKHGENPDGVARVREKKIDPGLVTRRVAEIVRFLRS